MVRVASAAVLVALLALTIWWLPSWATVVLAALAALVAGEELAGLARRTGADVPRSWAGVSAAVTASAFGVAGTALHGDAGLVGVVLLAVAVAAGAMALATSPPGPNALARPAVVVLAAVYVGAPLGAAAWVRVAGGPGPLTWLLAVIAISDSAQFYTGRWLGRRQLAPVVSPAKTVEGALGGLAAAAAAGAGLAGWWLPAVGPAEGAGLALLVSWFGMAGDLFQSILKRSAGVKDSSAIIPGHGGVLDRVDAYLFAAPVFYAFVRFAA